MSRWRPTGPARSVVIFAPGTDSASSDLAGFGKYLAAKGVALYAPDLRGQGHDRDPAQRGHFTDWPLWTQDFLHLADEARRRHPGAPVYFSGQSLGCLVALDAAAQAVGPARPRGLLLHSVPLLYLYPKAALSLGLPLIAAVVPNKTEPSAEFLVEHQQHLMTTWPAERDWLLAPERAWFTPAYPLAALRLGGHVRSELGRIDCPTLVHLGCLDGMAALARDPSHAAEKFRESLQHVPGGMDLVVHEGGHHELMLDPAYSPSVFSTDWKWLQAHR